MIFGDPEELREAQERAAMEHEAAVATVGNFYDSLTAEQMRALNTIMRAIVASEDLGVAAYHMGQTVALLRYKFNLCGCGDDHLADEHQKLRDATPATTSTPEKPATDKHTADNTAALDAYQVEYVEGGPKVRCKGRYSMRTGYPQVNCNMEWRNLDQRMMMNKCGNCGTGPA